MRKTLTFLSSAIILAGIFFLLRSYFPKYTLFLPYFLATLFLDLYLWHSIRKAVGSAKSLTRYLVTGFYWLPLLLLLSLIIAGFFQPFIYWNIFIRTYLVAIISIVYVCKLFPIFFLFLADVMRAAIRFPRFISGKKPLQIFKDAGKNSADLPAQQDAGTGGISVRNIILSAGWILGTALFVLLISGMILWNYDFRVREETFHFPELPASFDSTRIVQISDIHLGNWGCPDKLEKAVRIINSLDPDIVFFTGDLVNYSSYEADEFSGILKTIKAPMGIFAIMGNHDYGDYVNWPSPEAKRKNLEYLHETYRYMGWKLLLNEHVFLHKGTDSIAVIGVENWGGTRRFPRLGDIGKASKGTGNTPVKILLSHDPSHWDKIIKKSNPDIDITLSGHTHGFQFGVDCCGILWSPFQHIYNEWAGVYSEPVQGSHPKYLYVNRGLGSIGYPGRIGILPEITLINLVR